MTVMFNEQLTNELVADNDKAFKKLESINKQRQAGNASALVEGHALINPEHIAAAGEQIVSRIANSILTGKKAELLRKEVRVFLNILYPAWSPLKKNPEKATKVATQIANRLAEITISKIVDAVCISGRNDHLIQVGDDDVPVADAQNAASIVEAVGHAVEIELRLLTAKESHPVIYAAASRYLKDPVFGQDYAQLAALACVRGLDAKEQITAWAQDKRNYVMPAATEEAPAWVEWKPEESAFIAGFFQEMVDATRGDNPFWTVVLHADEDKKTHNFYVLSDAGHELFFNEIRRSAVSARSKDVMNMPPIKWLDGVFGGYASNQSLKLDSFIRRGKEGTQASETVYSAVNNAQAVAFTLNEWVLDCALIVKEYLTKDARKVGKFQPKVTGLNRAQLRKCVRTEFVLNKAVAQRGSVFWSPWNVDYRGRMYPIASSLHIQGTDFEKALLKVQDAQPVNDRTAYWLSIHLANTFGEDKLTLEDRVQWVKDNEDQIIKVVDAPIPWLLGIADGTEAFVADEPWQFLAAALEYVMCIVRKEWDHTNLLVAVDASCSGIQIISGLTQDEVAAEYVNVVPHYEDRKEVKSDAYREVAERAADMLTGKFPAPEKAEGFPQFAKYLNRKVAKKVVMTFAYNASSSTNSADIKDALYENFDSSELPADRAEMKQLVSVLGVVIREAMKQLLPKVLYFKQWVNQCAANYAAAHHELSWTTPSGMKVVQVKNEPVTVTLKTAFMGKRGEVTLKVRDSEDVAPNKHGTCTMPNYVHSMDASVLHMAFAKFDKPFTLVHDSVLTTASDMDAAIAAYKAAYIKHFDTDKYFNELVNMLGDYMSESKPVPAPTQGELDVKQVLVSKYFLA